MLNILGLRQNVKKYKTENELLSHPDMKTLKQTKQTTNTNPVRSINQKHNVTKMI